MLRIPCAFIFRVALLLTAPPSGFAQVYSYDGNRWLEAELVVFRHVTASLSVSEVPMDYAPAVPVFADLRVLDPAWASFLVDLEPSIPEESVLETGLVQDLPLATTQTTTSFGPAYSPPVARSYRIADFARDPFISLDRRHIGFTRDLQRLQNSPAHEVLWHAVWRQPLLGPAQTPAVQINSTSNYPWLDGGLRLLDGGNRVRLDLRLWLQANAGEAENSRYWTLVEQSELQLGEFYYFDNPAFGVLLQLRSYELPPLANSFTEEDF